MVSNPPLRKTRDFLFQAALISQAVYFQCVAYFFMFFAATVDSLFLCNFFYASQLRAYNLFDINFRQVVVSKITCYL